MGLASTLRPLCCARLLEKADKVEGAKKKKRLKNNDQKMKKKKQETTVP